MEFLKYQHVERLGSPETAGITEGQCFVFPKIDGTNASLWWNDGLQAGSRNRHLDLGNDNGGFLASMLEHQGIVECLGNKNWRLFGEWLIPHTLKTYCEDAWRKFYVFDVMDEDNQYIPYEEYREILSDHDIEYIPAIVTIKNPTEERLGQYLDDAFFLIRDGEGAGEGIVIKNYAFKNRFGRRTWAKIVRNEFKAKHTKEMGTREVSEKSHVEERIVTEFLTAAMVDKIYAKIVADNGGFSSRDIPRLLGETYYDLVREELWAALKKFKQPTVNFRALSRACNAYVKILKPELF